MNFGYDKKFNHVKILLNNLANVLKLPEIVVKHKYNIAAVIKKVKGECSTLEDILD